MADPGGQKVFVIAGVAQQKHASAVHKIRVRTQVEIEIAAHPAAAKNADPPVMSFRYMACVFQRLPRALHELAMLRIHNCSVFGRKTKELGIEVGEVVQRSTKRHIIAVTHQALRHTGLCQFVI